MGILNEFTQDFAALQAIFPPMADDEADKTIKLRVHKDWNGHIIKTDKEIVGEDYIKTKNLCNIISLGYVGGAGDIKSNAEAIEKASAKIFEMKQAYYGGLFEGHVFKPQEHATLKRMFHVFLATVAAQDRCAQKIIISYQNDGYIHDPNSVKQLERGAEHLHDGYLELLRLRSKIQQS